MTVPPKMALTCAQSKARSCGFSYTLTSSSQLTKLLGRLGRNTRNVIASTKASGFHWTRGLVDQVVAAVERAGFGRLCGVAVGWTAMGSADGTAGDATFRLFFSVRFLPISAAAQEIGPESCRFARRSHAALTHDRNENNLRG